MSRRKFRIAAAVATLFFGLTACQPVNPGTFAASADPLTKPNAEPLAEGAVAWVNKPVVYTYRSPGDPNPARASRAFSNKNTFGGPQVFTVKAVKDDWYLVDLPVRPNGTAEWVHRNDLDIRYTTHRVVVDVSERTARVYNDNQLLLSTRVVVGKGSTPTPTGLYYINVSLRRTDDSGAYGPYILGLSGFSEILSSFNGGEPTIGMHGTNKPSLLGTAASNGCIRFPNNIITLMTAELPLGTPVHIVP